MQALAWPSPIKKDEMATFLLEGQLRYRNWMARSKWHAAQLVNHLSTPSNITTIFVGLNRETVKAASLARIFIISGGISFMDRRFWNGRNLLDRSTGQALGRVINVITSTRRFQLSEDPRWSVYFNVPHLVPQTCPQAPHQQMSQIVRIRKIGRGTAGCRRESPVSSLAPL